MKSLILRYRHWRHALRKRFGTTWLLFLSLCSFLPLLSSCVHEFPEPGSMTEVRLTLVHELSWSEYEFIYNRRGATRVDPATDWKARYIIRAHRPGDTSSPVYEFVRSSDDVSLAPFTTSISLPSGEWDLYVWQDMTAGEQTFHDTSDFSRISYTSPYTGDTDWRDVFEGRTRVAVESSYEAGYFVGATIDMERPMAKYEFIATDFGKFYDEVLMPSVHAADFNEKKTWASLSLSEKKKLLAGYSITAYYPMFMPSVYDLFQQKAVDSARGMRYKAQIVPINDTEAVVSMDYVFMNHRESSVQVMLMMHTPNGQNINMTPTVQVPLRRKCITYVRGEFLTTGASGGLNIDFGFTDDFNIEI